MTTFADPVDEIGAWAKWDRVLTAGELAVLPARLDA